MTIEAFERQNCPIAQTLAFLGERWSILVLREIFFGRRRFDQMQETLGVAPNILSARLKTLEQEGVVERRPYGERNDRFEYRLTEKGLELQPVLLQLQAWGNRHRSPAGGPARVLVHKGCGHEVEPVETCSHCGERLDPGNVIAPLGPGANAAQRAREAA